MADSGPVDLLVIGGGINGAGIARDAAGRGLSVVLCEQDDLASTAVDRVVIQERPVDSQDYVGHIDRSTRVNHSGDHDLGAIGRNKAGLSVSVKGGAKALSVFPIPLHIVPFFDALSVLVKSMGLPGPLKSMYFSP